MVSVADQSASGIAVESWWGRGSGAICKCLLCIALFCVISMLLCVASVCINYGEGVMDDESGEDENR